MSTRVSEVAQKLSEAGGTEASRTEVSSTEASSTEAGDTVEERRFSAA